MTLYWESVEMECRMLSPGLLSYNIFYYTCFKPYNTVNYLLIFSHNCGIFE